MAGVGWDPKEWKCYRQGCCRGEAQSTELGSLKGLGEITDLAQWERKF